jgi:FADH2-dependent halogenase
MTQHDADILIIGCGPGGSSAATFLAQAGHSVLVLEKERFPRFHVGESLLPYNMPLFEELGVASELQQAGFPRKLGARFHLADGVQSHRFVFREGAFTRHTESLQVERALFDHILMKRARAVGADVREGWTVKRFSTDDQGVTVEALDGQGRPHELRARYLLDASGRANLTGNQENQRMLHPRHRKLAVFGHFRNVKLPEGEARADTAIVRGLDHWFWLIPVSAERTSVGLVMDKDALATMGGSAEEAFWRAVRQSPILTEWLAPAELSGALRTTSDFSYHNRRLGAPRLLRVGDAAGFLDPIFSAGVFLAMWSGKRAAATVQEGLRRKAGHLRHGRYEREVFQAMKLYWRLVEKFYTTEFIELFTQPRPVMQVPAAVVAVLAGELEGGWRVRWRLEMFYLLVWLQKHVGLVPRLSLDGASAPASAATASAASVHG